MTDDTKARHDRMHDEMLDSFDEELEMEIDDDRLAKLLAEMSEHPERGDHRPARLFQGAVPPAGRAGQAAGLGAGTEAQGRGDLRGARRGRQGRRHQAHHAAAQSARLPRRRAAGAERARAHAVVFPALRRPPAGRRRDRAVRPQLVQPRRRRARDGLLHAPSSRGVLPTRCPSSSRCWCAPGSS